ncbi:restriction endonuclease [Vibrio fluvialis]|nr:restriction endonuclease [Vibrio fluvialis]
MSDVKWEKYEEVAQYLINQFAEKFDLAGVEGKQKVPGESGASWEIDAKGVRKGDESIVLVECKRYTKSKVTQEIVAGLAYRIKDTDASGGIIVSPLGTQKGADLIANHEGIISVKLNEDSTTQEYVLEFLNNICVGLHDSFSVNIKDSFSIKVIHADCTTERFD